MKPEIRFCKTPDGLSIAYATMGTGPMLVFSSTWLSFNILYEQSEAFRDFAEKLARHHTLVYFDKPGFGLSDRERKDFSLESHLTDMEAVIGQVDDEVFALFGLSGGVPLSIAYAVKYPQRVSHLILFGGYASGAKLSKPEVRDSLLALVRANWGIGSGTLAQLFIPDRANEPEALKELKQYQRDSATPEMAARHLQANYEFDASNMVPKVAVPTLVIHRRGDRAISPDLGRELAAGIPGARLVMLEGDIHLPYFGDSDAVVRHVLEFLGDE
ncbi:MAG: alpha/beta fold hydrolase, partial [bacterium]